jgi:hypothetical protein
MIFLCLFTCFSLFADVYQTGISLGRFHVCTVASDSHPRLDQLIESCKVHQIELDVLGMGLPYPKNGVKLLYMIDYLKRWEDDEVILFVDAYDTLILVDKERILEKFLRSERPFIMGAEKNCAPNPDLAPHFEKGPTPFRFINTGTYIGYVKNIRAWLEALHPNAYMCDQYQTALYYLRSLKNRSHFTLDIYCDFFFSSLIQCPLLGGSHQSGNADIYLYPHPK